MRRRGAGGRESRGTGNPRPLSAADLVHAGYRGELRHFIGTSVFDPDGHFYECNQVTAIDEPEDFP